MNWRKQQIELTSRFVGGLESVKANDSSLRLILQALPLYGLTGPNLGQTKMAGVGYEPTLVHLQLAAEAHSETMSSKAVSSVICRR